MAYDIDDDEYDDEYEELDWEEEEEDWDEEDEYDNYIVQRQGNILFYGHYNTGKQHGYFKSLKSAVKFFLSDILTGRLERVSDENKKILWSLDEGYEAGERTNTRQLMKLSHKEVIAALIGVSTEAIRSKTGIDGRTEATENGFRLLDENGNIARIFKLILKEEKIQRHEFGQDFLCKTCGKSMMALEDPMGNCTR